METLNKCKENPDFRLTVTTLSSGKTFLNKLKNEKDTCKVNEIISKEAKQYQEDLLKSPMLQNQHKNVQMFIDNMP